MVYATIRQHGDVLKTEKSNGDVNSPVNEGVNTIGQGAMMTYSLIQETLGINTPQLVILSGKRGIRGRFFEPRLGFGIFAAESILLNCEKCKNSQWRVLGWA